MIKSTGLNRGLYKKWCQVYFIYKTSLNIRLIYIYILNYNFLFEHAKHNIKPIIITPPKTPGFKKIMM